MQPQALHGAVALPDWGVIRAVGSDARSFLDSQLTHDVPDPGTARVAGYCSPKGRLLASFIVWQRTPDDVLLACSADLAAAALKRLSMHVLRARCKLSDASVDRPLHGVAGTTALLPGAEWQHMREGDADLIRLPDAAGVPRLLWAGAGVPDLPGLSLAGWRWLEVQSGIVRIVAATADQFVPQMVNLDIVGGVSFSKGCYPGQEVVARSQYRGTLKRRAFVLTTDATAAPGQEIVAAADPGQPAGMVALAAPGAVLAEVKLAALDGALHLGHADGPLLTPSAQPYALPAAA